MKISIITVCYNSENTIERTIQSVISQNKDNLIEYILIDGGSTDKTMEIVEKYKSNFKVIVSEKDNGISDAFNKGIQLATGDIIGLVNSDDIIYKGAIDKIKENYEKDIDIYYGDKIVIDNIVKSRSYQKADDLINIKYSLPFCHQSCYISRDCYQKFGTYSTEYKCCMDFELLLKMYNGNAKFKYIDYPLCEFSMGGASDSYATMNEVYIISTKEGLSKFKALLYYLKCFIRTSIKIFLTKVKLLNLARKFRNKKGVDYNTLY